ncbi:MAG: hypothetical protein AAFY45_00360 [Bacteroidota bacterium]
MKEIIYTCLLLIFLSGCVKEESQRIVYSDNASTIEEVVNRDETSKQIADFPFQFYPGGKLVHILGSVGHFGRYKNIDLFSSETSEPSFEVSHRYGGEIGGNIEGILFQALDSDYLKPLSTEDIRILNIHFMQDLYQKNGKDYILYKIVDKDSNQDQLLDKKDVVSLYISRGDGSDFIKLSNDQEEIISWKFLPELERIYFKTLADSNKDGKFDIKDQLGYHYVDLSGEEPILHSYDPFSEPKKDKKAT